MVWEGLCLLCMGCSQRARAGVVREGRCLVLFMLLVFLLMFTPAMIVLLGILFADAPSAAFHVTQMRLLSHAPDSQC